MPVLSVLFSLFTASNFFYSAHRNSVLCLEEKSKNFASQMFSSGFFVVHDTSGGGHDDVTVKKENK